MSDFVSPYTGMTEQDWLGQQGWMKGGRGMFIGPDSFTTTALPRHMEGLYDHYYSKSAQQRATPQPVPQPAPQAPAPLPSAPAPTPAAPAPQAPPANMPQSINLGDWINQMRSQFQGGSNRQSSFGGMGQGNMQNWQQTFGDFLSRFRGGQ